MGIGDRFRAYWCGPGSTTRLAVFRIIVCACAIRHACDMHTVALLSTLGGDGLFLEIEWQPLFLFEVFGLSRPNANVLRILHVLHVGFLLGAMVGVRTRTSCALAAILHYYASSVRAGYGQAHHGDIAMMFALGALPLVPCGLRLSWDSFKRQIREARSSMPDEPPLEVPVARYAIHLTQWTIAIGYCAAATSKLLIVGPEWCNGYTLQMILLSGGTWFGDTMASSRAVVQVLSIGTVLAQITFPLCVIYPRLRWLSIPAIWGFHLSTEAAGVTGPYITLWAIVLAAFVPLDRVLPSLRSWSRGSTSRLRPTLFAVSATLMTLFLVWLFASGFSVWIWLLAIPAEFLILFTVWPRPRTVVFDGACPRCRRTVVVIRCCDWASEIRAVDLRNWDDVRQLNPSLDEGRCRASMHVLAGSGVVDGYAGYLSIAARLPLFAPLVPLLRIAPIRKFGSRLYEERGQDSYCR